MVLQKYYQTWTQSSGISLQIFLLVLITCQTMQGSKTFDTSQSRLEAGLKCDESWFCEAWKHKAVWSQLYSSNHGQDPKGGRWTLWPTYRCSEGHCGFVPPRDARDTSWDIAFGRCVSNKLKRGASKEMRQDAITTGLHFKWWAARMFVHMWEESITPLK